jgi:hypothetical protein
MPNGQWGLGGCWVLVLMAFFFDLNLIEGFRLNGITSYNQIFQLSYNVPSYQIEALQDLYDSTNGWQWNWKVPLTEYGVKWNFSQTSPNPCIEGWQGISCSSDCSHAPCLITELVLDGYGLDGTLPMSLGNITSLITLQIYSNPLLSGQC